MAESEFLPPPWRRVLAGSLLLTPVFRPIATQAPSWAVPAADAARFAQLTIFFHPLDRH
jgi:hypothetical protein